MDRYFFSEFLLAQQLLGQQSTPWRTLCTMAKKTFLHIASVFYAAPSAELCPTAALALPINLPSRLTPKPFLNHTACALSTWSYCWSAIYCVYYSVTKYIPHLLLPSTLKYPAVPTTNRHGQLDFSNRISLHFNFRLSSPPNNRAHAHMICPTAIGG